jgi:flagellar biosynthesis protein FlhG
MTPPDSDPAAKRARLLAIASGKGGVGKTWLAAALARELTLRRRRVLLLDGDLGLANIDIQLGLAPRHDLFGVIAGQRGLGESAELYAPGGFAVLAGCSGSGALATLDPAALDHLLALLAVETGFDDIVLDLGAGLSRTVRRLAAAADRLLVVATAEPTSLTDAYAVVKVGLADRPGLDVRIVVNQASSPAAGLRTYANLAKACQTFLGTTPPLAGVVRSDGCVPDAIRRQVLLQHRHPNAKAAQDVERLAAAL